MNGTSTTLNSLALDLTYDVYVRNDCGAGLYSSNGSPVQFTIINGDDCTRVIDLATESAPFFGSTTGANNDVSIHDCGTFNGGDIILSYTVDVDATITFFAAHDYAATVSVNYGASCPGTTVLTCEADLAEFSWTNTTGVPQTVYWIQDGVSEGDFSLEWFVEGACILGAPGTPCYAGPLFGSGMVNSECECEGQDPVSCSNDLTLEFQTDANPDHSTWELLEQGTDFVVQSGGPLNASNGVETNFTCLPDGCYYLRVYDSAGDGMTSGGYILRTTGTNLRIIDNRNNFNTGSISAISGGQGFCLPMSSDKVVFTSCDKLDWINGQYVVANPNPSVSAEWIPNGANGVQDANSGYEFWIFDPNGSYSFRRFRSHNVSDGFAASATRACHMKLNNWTAANHVPVNVLMNVRVRARINGVNGEFGPACRLAIDPALAACPQTNLMDIPGNQYYSCGSTRQYGAGNYVHARPVSGANRYQFRFRIAAEGFEVVRQASTYFVQLNWTGPTALVDGKTYDVDVRISKDGGATWCTSADPWGNVCQFTIDNTPANSGNQNFAAEGATAELRMFPNPSQGGVLNFSISAVKEGVNTVSVDIFDLTGARVAARTIAVSGGSVNTVLDLNGDLAAGMYLVNITAGETVYTERLVIQP